MNLRLGLVFGFIVTVYFSSPFLACAAASFFYLPLPLRPHKTTRKKQLQMSPPSPKSSHLAGGSV
jgi:hypothetical protein